MKLEVWDKDGFMNPDDLLGFTSVDVSDLLKNPSEFKINGNYTFDNNNPDFKKFKNFGDVYLQARFIPQGSKIEGSYPAVTENLEEVVLAATHNGEIHLRIVHVDNVPITDSGLEGSKSDPYVVVQYPDKKEWKTKVKKNCLKPIFDEENIKKIKVISFVRFHPVQPYFSNLEHFCWHN